MARVTLSDGRVVTVNPPTGLARIEAQRVFGQRFKTLATVQPTDEAEQRKVITRWAWSLARYTQLTPAELIAIITTNPYDGTVIAQAVFTERNAHGI